MSPAHQRGAGLPILEGHQWGMELNGSLVRTAQGREWCAVTLHWSSPSWAEGKRSHRQACIWCYCHCFGISKVLPRALSRGMCMISLLSVLRRWKACRMYRNTRRLQFDNMNPIWYRRQKSDSSFTTLCLHLKNTEIIIFKIFHCSK